MKSIRIFGAFALVLAVTSAWAGGKAIPADSMGLSKESVFNVPRQHVYHEPSAQPGTSKLLPRAYLNAPPQISHNIQDFVPITTDSNMCQACHARPDLWDVKERAQGDPTPIPQSHYTDLRNSPDKIGDQVVGARYNCTQCHVPQLNAKQLVSNTFGTRK